MRQRIEDLGRIAVMISNIIEEDVFSKYEHIRKKDFLDWFSEQTEEQRDEIVHNLIYGLSNVQELLYEVYGVAMGDDAYNQPKET